MRGENRNPIIVHFKRALKAGALAGLEPPPLGPRARGALTAGAAPGQAASGAETAGTGEISPVPGGEAPGGRLEGLEELRGQIGDCRRCKLWDGRRNIVFGEGSAGARLVFVGEGPGREEDLQGRPFVGEAGRMLTRIINNVLGLNRDDVYICNVVKCRPPGNRDPEPDEIAACVPFLTAQLSAIRPEVICVLGRVAGTALLGKDFKITRDRGRWYTYDETPVMPTFHPAYILRNTGRQRELKRLVWEDIKQVVSRLGLEVK
jgi:uracil-DNA glycosylase